MKDIPNRVCIIGAGSSGIAACKVLKEHGIPFDCYEAGDRVGGNWVYENVNGMSSAYKSLFINTSKPRMQYSDFPMPEHYPIFPHHTHIASEYKTIFISIRGSHWRNQRRAVVGRLRCRMALPIATAPCSSQMATTGTRAGPNQTLAANLTGRSSTAISTNNRMHILTSMYWYWALVTQPWISRRKPRVSQL